MASQSAKNIVALYSDCAKEATKAFIKNWAILPASIAAYALAHFSSSLLSPLGVFGGFILGLIQTALLAYYFSWIAEAFHNKRKLPLKDFLHFDSALFMSVISVAFILWVIKWVVSMLITGMHAEWILYCLRAGLVLLFNSLPESIYINNQDGSSALQDSAAFVQKNWIEWYLPFALVLSPLLFVVPLSQISLLLSVTYPLLPTSVLFYVPSVYASVAGALITSLLGIILANWFMLFRAFLFSKLNTGSKRLREFQAKIKG